MGETVAAADVPLWRRALGSRGLQMIAGAVVLAWALDRWLAAAGGAAALHERFGWGAAALVASAQSLIAFVPVLGEMIAFTNAALFGLWLGSAVSWVAWMLNAWIQCALVRRTAHDLDVDTHMERLPRWLRRFPAHHPAFLIGVRLLLGGPIVNAAAGALGVPWWRFTWCAALAIAPRALFFSLLALGWLRL